MNKFAELVSICKAGVYLESQVNEDSYETAERYYGFIPNEHVGPIDWNKTIYRVQCYPKTPVGFISAISNNLDALLDWAIDGAKDY